ncbi:hypothetical protein [Cellulosilyticum ruminicola]|uniref:hypothetical protein n=1 Tax=Cellulosilyticum ruminicola TaxID=425254 RepID=UPI0006D2001D|nr:hypothetical protein [Cellulosilyticum ruminicola]
MYQEEPYELFEGDIRKLDELISQLELWSDEYTVNHKKEEVRLPEYMDLHENLEELKGGLKAFIDERRAENDEKIEAYATSIVGKLEKYKETEEVIHEWIRNIKNVYVIVMKSPILEKNRAYINDIMNA